MQNNNNSQLAAPLSSGSAVEIKTGHLYHYPEGRGWCRHGLLRAEERRDGSLILVDTYWGSAQDFPRNWHTPEEVAGKVEFMLDLSNAKQVYREEFDRYKDKDRAYIPIGGGREQLWVRKDAKPNPALIEDQLRAKLSSAESNLRMAQWAIERAQEELAEFLTAHSPDGEGASNAAGSDSGDSRDKGRL
jgi:hypothetical protein